ncbi:hypothetical protein V1504DRAFT_489948 [Lipomyces starkeyi]
MDGHKLDLITHAKANETIKSHHDRTTSLGCWESNAKLNQAGYYPVTVSAGGKRFKTFLYQITLIAHERLCAVAASHLCHNRKCFNPEHLVACNGHKILLGADFSYHPCAHGSVEKMRKCILPVQHLQATMPHSETQASTEATPAPDLDNIANNNGALADRLDSITPMMGKELVDKYHVATTDLGCWVSKLKPDTNGRCVVVLWKLNVRLTGSGKRSTYYSVSNLCHNRQCFNPEHLIVESTSDFRKRKVCKGKTIVVHETRVCMVALRGCINASYLEDQPSTEATPAPDLDDTVTASNDADADAGVSARTKYIMSNVHMRYTA